MPENNTSEIDEIDDLMRRIYARQEKATTVDRGEGEDAEAMEKPDARDRLLSQKAMRDMAQQEAGEQLRRELEIAGRPVQRYQVMVPDGSVYNLVSESFYRDIMTRAEAAERRVAELEAQLASAVNVGQGVAISVAQHYEATQATENWRPVTEEPAEMDAMENYQRIEMRTTGIYRWDKKKHIWVDEAPDSFPKGTEWRPAPPQE